MAVQSSPSQLALQKQFHDYLGQAFTALEAGVSPGDCEAIALAIEQSMVGPSRFFHTLGHCMSVGGMAVGGMAAESMVRNGAVAAADLGADVSQAGVSQAAADPIEMLAGAFHDVVYVQVDGGIPFSLTHCISPVVEQRGEAMVLRQPQPGAENLRWLLPLFDLSPGQVLSPRTGQNEFLSALVAVTLLEPYLATEVLLAIALCIEATIPFRNGPNPDSQPEAMLLRLAQICQANGLNLSEAEQGAMIRRSVRVANRDVISFAESSAAHFLADTWNLLPENHQFSPGGSHRIQDYREVIEKTEAFFLKLDPRCIFRQFRGEPSDQAFAQWQRQAQENLAVGQLYLSCKLVAIALLEAVASPFGPQTALSLFMGTLPESTGGPPLRLEQFFPPPHWSGPTLSEQEEQVWQLLSQGRAASSHQGDVLYSPLATFMLQFHGFESLPQQRQAAQSWLGGSLPCNQFLQHFDSQFLALFFESIRRLWEQRQMVLDAYFRPQSETPVQVSSGGLAINLATRRQ